MIYSLNYFYYANNLINLNSGFADIIVIGEMPEWLYGAVSKTVELFFEFPGFESLSLRKRENLCKRVPYYSEYVRLKALNNLLRA